MKREPKTADWRRQRQVVKRILGKIGPLAPARMDCLHDVIFAVRVIANKTLREPSGKMKSQLKATATALRKARSALASLSGHLRYCVLVALDPPQTRQQALCGGAGERFIGDLDRLIERCDDQARCLDQPRRIQSLDQAGQLATRIDEPKGGPKGARLDADRKAYAAIAAFESLTRYGDGFPEGNRFYKTASLLFEAATGRAEVDCKAACLDCSLPVRKQAAFNRLAWRRRESPTTA
jgi:hypothetical protein